MASTDMEMLLWLDVTGSTGATNDIDWQARESAMVEKKERRPRSRESSSFGGFRR